MGVILYIVSLILRAILVPAAMIYNIIKLFRESHFDRAFKYTDHAFLAMAKSVDKYGNAVCEELFNDVLISKESEFPFGKIDQTISQVLGLNLKAGTLSRTGLAVNNFLNFLWKDHTIKATAGND